MKRIIVLVTCHNRVDKTVAAIRSLQESFRNFSTVLDYQVVMTDDGSSDGTADVISRQFPDIIILEGSGDLFWAGGMRMCWQHAINLESDGFLLFNDDTIVYPQFLQELLLAHDFALQTYGCPGIYIGSVCDPNTGEFTYGGRELSKKWSFETKRILPNGKIQECQLGNANIMLIHQDVIKKVGALSDKYTHSKADFDYTLRAIEHHFPVLVAGDYCGECERDRNEPDFSTMSLRERVTYLRSPKGLEISGYLYFIRRFFPFWRMPMVFASQWMKVLVPKSKDIIDFFLRRN